MAAMIGSGIYHAVLGSRVLGRGALAGGMPRYKYLANRALTFVQNLCVTQRLTEYHTGYRAFSREVLLRLPLEENSNDFVFDNQMLLQLIYFGYEIAEITCPARYFAEASSINLWRSLKYGSGVLQTTARYLAARSGLRRDRLFQADGGTLMPDVIAPEVTCVAAAAPPFRALRRP
jgi:hypothetical protein